MPDPHDHDLPDAAAPAAVFGGSVAVRAVPHPPPRTPGTAGVRVYGGNDVAVIVMILRAEADGGQLEITSEHGPYPNHPDPGLRMDLTLRFPARNPAAPHAEQTVNCQAEALLAATQIPEMQTTAEVLRDIALRVRRLVMRPVPAGAYLKLAPSVVDPQRQRIQLADLAVDVVTAADYLLSLLGASAATPPLVLGREPGSDHGRGPAEGAAFFRLMQRRLDACAIVVKLATCLAEGLRSDATTH